MKRNLMRAVPPVPERYLAKMDDILKEISDMEHLKKHRYSYGALAVALALLIALAGLAYAAATQSGILDRLFPGATPPPEVERAIVRDLVVDSQDGVTLSIDEHMYDGTTLNFDWTVSSARKEPVYYLTEWATNQDDLKMAATGGEESRSASSSSMIFAKECLFAVLDGADGELGVGPSRSEYYQSTAWGAQFDGPFEVTVTVHAFTSPLNPVILLEDEWEMVWEPDDPLQQQLVAARRLGVSSGHTNVVAYPQYQEVLDRYYPVSEAILRNYPDYKYTRYLRPDQYAETGLMVPLATLTATVIIETTDTSSFWHTEPVQRSYDYSGGRIEIRELDFSPGTTRMVYHLYPDGPLEAPLESERTGILLDESGKEMLSTVSTSHGGDDDYYEVTANANPLPQPPKCVYLVVGLNDEEYLEAMKAGTLMQNEKVRIELRVVE